MNCKNHLWSTTSASVSFATADDKLSVDILAGAIGGEDIVEMVGNGEVISTLIGGVPTTDFGFDSLQRTLIWRAGFVLCVDEKIAARIVCGTVSIGAILSNETVFRTNF